MWNFMKVLFSLNKTLSGSLPEFKKKENAQLGNPKSGSVVYGSGRLRELFLTVQTGFHKDGRN